MPSFTFAFYAFADITANSGSPLTTTATTGASGSFTVNSGAIPVVITVDDDDTDFDDAFIDPGTDQLLQSVDHPTETYPLNTVVELEFRVSTSPAPPDGVDFFYVRINGTNVGIGGTSLPVPGVTYSIDGSMDSQDELYANLACFVAGTLIRTPAGDQKIDELSVGDEVLTLDRGAQSVRWIGKRTLSLEELERQPDLAPVRFAPGAFNNRRALYVSPQHRMLATGWRPELFFGTDSVLIPAKAMVDGKSITRTEPERAVTYYHLLFDQHEIVWAEGCASESFHPGVVGLSGLDTATRLELVRLFPELEFSPNQTARQVVTVREAQAADWS